MMRIGSLCSGAGGLDMAVEAVLGARTVWHSELEKLTDKDGRARRNAAVDVLAAHWPGVPNHGDLTTVDWDRVEPVDVLTGGYPCQPFSAAGKRKGVDDERHIWPGVREAIRRLRPRYTFLENVAGHRSLGFDRVLGDLAEDGLHARWISLRAADVGGCHGRERLWILVTDPDRGRLEVGAERDSEPLGPELKASQWLDADRRGDDAVDLLPTPNASDTSKHAGQPADKRRDRGHSTRLTDVVECDLLPTPTSRDGKGEANRPGRTRGGRLRTSGDDTLPDAIIALLPTPAAADGDRGPDYARAGRDGSGGDDLVTICARATHGRGSNWGKYDAAVHRWEALTRPAPSPTEPNTKGNPRLNPAFSEWMMGWPAGWVTDIPSISRNDQLRIIGNGVVPQCGAAALRSLLHMAVAA